VAVFLRLGFSSSCLFFLFALNENFEKKPFSRRGCVAAIFPCFGAETQEPEPQTETPPFAWAYRDIMGVLAHRRWRRRFFFFKFFLSKSPGLWCSTLGFYADFIEAACRMPPRWKKPKLECLKKKT